MLHWFILGYLLATLVVGYAVSRWIRTAGDFILAGKRLNALMVGVTIFATWFGSDLIMGIPTNFVHFGLLGVMDQAATALCLILIAIFFARPLYRMKILTVSDFFRIKYGKNIERISSIIGILTYLPWIAAQFLALSLIFQTIFGTGIIEGTLIGAAIVVFYTYIGGMWAVSVTDMIQSVIIVAGLIYLALVLAGETGGISPVLAATPDGFFDVFPPDGLKSWSDYITGWLIFGVGLIVSQEIYQRVWSARNENDGVRGTYLSAVLLTVIAVIPYFICLAISQKYPEYLTNNEGQNMIPEYVLGQTGIFTRIMFFGALISAILSTSSGAMLAPATLLSENIIKPVFPKMSDKQLLASTRMGVVIVAVLSVVLTFFSTRVHDLIINSILPYLICLFAPFALGLYWKKSSATGAWLAIFLGAATWIFCNYSGTEINPTLYAVAVSFSGMIGGSLLFPSEPVEN
jgi:SSS family solute:Na+ symporter